MFKLSGLILANQLVPSLFIFLDPLIIVSIMGLLLWLNLKMKQKKNWARISCLILVIGIGLIAFWCHFVLVLNGMRDELLKAFYLLHSIIAIQLCLSLIRKDIKPWFSEKKMLPD
jgi:ABC-type dipeptide/oligopeptide/nickel transport system permease component